MLSSKLLAVGLLLALGAGGAAKCGAKQNCLEAPAAASPSQCGPNPGPNCPNRRDDAAKSKKTAN